MKGSCVSLFDVKRTYEFDEQVLHAWGSLISGFEIIVEFADLSSKRKGTVVERAAFPMPQMLGLLKSTMVS